MLKQYELGKISDQYVITSMKMYKEVRERVKLLMQAYLACKPKTIEDRLHTLNIVNRGEAISEQGDLEFSMLKCPDLNDKIITRADCLSFSGSSANMQNCQTCKNFKHTRDLLLPERTNGL